MPSTKRNGSPQFRFRLRTLFGLVALCAVGSCCVLSFRNRVAHNVSRHDAPIWGLPEDASSINYFLPGAFGPDTYFEFNTTERSFLEWVRSFPNVKPVDGEPYRIYRYNGYGPDADHRSEVTITNGYLYEWTEEDRGQQIAYDKDAGRAYYWSHSR